jgi:hypothetical protein
MSADHRDNRGVFIETWVIDLVGGDFPAAMYLSQLLWWHQPAKDGDPRARFGRAGQRWLLRADDEWWDECRLSERTVRRVRRLLTDRGLIEVRKFRHNGAPTSAARPLYAAIREQSATDARSDASASVGSDASASVGSDASASLPPISTSQLDLSSSRAAGESVPGARAQPLQLLTEPGERAKDPIGEFFDEWWDAYPRKLAKRAARKAFGDAIRRHGGMAKADPIITTGMLRWNQHWQAERTAAEHIPYPATWLNGDYFATIPDPRTRRAR